MASNWLSKVFSRSSAGSQGGDDRKLSKESRQNLLDGTALSTPHLNLRQTLKAAWQMTKPYFTTSEHRQKARLLLAGVVGLTLGQVGLALWLNEWRGGLWDSFANVSAGDFASSMKEFGVVGSLWIAASVYRGYLEGLLQVDWRDWMTKKLENSWLSNKVSYRMQKENSQNDPDQRLTTDIVDFCWKSQSLTLSFMNSALSLGIFSKVLWDLGGALSFQAGGTGFTIPGYMMGLALAYAVAGTYAMQKIGKSLPMIHNYRQRYEADFRYSLIRVRENAEAIAMYGGEKVEEKTLSEKFNRLVDNLYQLVRKNKQVAWLGTSFGTVGEVVPLAASAPRLFAGALTVGGMQKVAGAFGHVVGAMSWMMSAYPTIAEYQATTTRLHRFMESIDNKAAGGESRIRVVNDNAEAADPSARLSLNGVSLIRPDKGTALVKPFSLTLKPGDRMVLTGVAGSGKSSLLRAIAGIWNHGDGTVTVNREARVLCIPQKPYLPLTSLRGIVCYPREKDDFTDHEVRIALETAGLGHLAPLLDDEKLDGSFWAQTLSGGEQQRVAFARVFLHKPDILMLDEVTSSMDPAAENDLYSRVVQSLPDTVMISIAHREKVLAFHNLHARIEDQTFTVNPLPPPEQPEP